MVEKCKFFIVKFKGFKGGTIVIGFKIYKLKLIGFCDKSDMSNKFEDDLYLEISFGISFHPMVESNK